MAHLSGSGRCYWRLYSCRVAFNGAHVSGARFVVPQSLLLHAARTVGLGGEARAACRCVACERACTRARIRLGGRAGGCAVMTNPGAAFGEVTAFLREGAKNRVKARRTATATINEKNKKEKMFLNYFCLARGSSFASYSSSSRLRVKKSDLLITQISVTSRRYSLPIRLSSTRPQRAIS